MDRRLADQREFIDAKFIHISAIMRTEFEHAKEQRDGITERQDITNGRVNALEKDIIPVRHIAKNRRFYAMAVIAAIIFISCVSLFVERKIDTRQTIENMYGIEFKRDTIN
jgi:hypothetical protein